MLFPVKLKLATYEAEALRKYMQRMLEISLNADARNEVILLGEFYPKIESIVRSKLFKLGNRVSTYSIPLSVARTLWYRWQQEDNGEVIQMILGKIDYQLNSIQRVPKFPTKLI